MKHLINTLALSVLIIAAILLILHFTKSDFLQAYVVSSGSMEPVIKTGSLALVRPSANYSNNDIITFSPKNNHQSLVTHRILAKTYPQGINNQPIYLTAGDAVSNFDKWQTKNEHIVGKVIFTIPYLGYAVNFTQQPQGFLILVIIPATIVVYEEIKKLIRELKKLMIKLKNKLSKEQPTGLPSGNQFTLPRAATILPLIGITLAFLSFSMGFFTDDEASAQNTLSTAASFSNSTPTPTPSDAPNGASPTPTPVPGINPGDIVINEINWAGSNGAGLDEWLELKNMTGNPIDISNWVVEKLGTGSGPGANIILPASSTIPANGFFLISERDRATSKIDVDPDYVTTSISLVNGGEQLKLKTDTTTLIDTANGAGAWFEGTNSTPKKSMERKNPPADGTVGANWKTATTHTNMDNSGPTDEFGTPKAENGV